MAQGRSGRQLLAVAVFIASSAALVATSPPVPPTRTLDARASATATLSAGSPVASTTVTFSASDEALWSDDPEIRITTASLYFSVNGIGTGGGAPTRVPPGASGPSGAPVVRLTVVPLADGRQRDPIPGSLTGASVDLRQACQPDRDCRAEYELLLEWVDPAPALDVTVVVESTALIQIEGSESLPVGARAGLEASRPVAVEVPLVSDGVEGTATVDAAHPLAMWSVVVDADAGAIPAPLAWPIESRGTFVATIAPGPEGRPTEYGEGPGAAMIVIPEDGPELVPQGGATDRLAFDPFAGCRPAEPCRRRFTVVARWFAPDPTYTAGIDWRFDAGIVFHGEVGPGAGAAVRATVEAQTIVTTDGPGLSASVDGVATLDPSKPGISTRRTIQLAIPALALASDLLGGPVPAVTARVRLDAHASEPVGGDPIAILTDWGPEASFARPRYQFPDPLLDGGAVDAVVFPAIACRADRACAVEMQLGLGLSANDAPRVAKVEVTVAWTVDVELRYPPGARPPASVAMDLRDVTP